MTIPAVVYQPTQIIIFTDNGAAALCYFPLNDRCIAEALPDDRGVD